MIWTDLKIFTYFDFKVATLNFPLSFVFGTADAFHFTQKLWPSRDEFLSGSKNVKAHPLVALAKVFFTIIAYQVRLHEKRCESYRQEPRRI